MFREPLGGAARDLFVQIGDAERGVAQARDLAHHIEAFAALRLDIQLDIAAGLVEPFCSPLCARPLEAMRRRPTLSSSSAINICSSDVPRE